MYIGTDSLSCEIYGKSILRKVSCNIEHGEIVAIVGGSGCGKSTLLNHFMMLMRPTNGYVYLFGHSMQSASKLQVRQARQRMGVLFQHGALFTGLNVLENVMFPMQEHTELSTEVMIALARIKIALVGLPPESAVKYPNELSGGMQKRAALARAIALDPELLLLDEPTAGLDPFSAGLFDNLVLELRNNLGLTVVMVTHDLDSLQHTADKIIFLGEEKILGIGSVEEVAAIPHPLIKRYFEREINRIGH